MKNSDRNGDQMKKSGEKGHRKEWGIAIFSLLMATALPALVAMMAGISAGAESGRLTDQAAVCMSRHGTGEVEEQTMGGLIALSLAATNSSDTPAASLEAQAILLRSRGVWWMDYCTDWEENGSTGEESGTKTKTETEKNTKKGEKKQVEGDGTKKRSLPVLCDSPSHGLPYLSYAELVELWGKEEADARISVAERAVKLTRGQVLCYEGEVVPALLHHSSSGVTRSVESLPWLSAVATPEMSREAISARSAEEVRHMLAARFGLLLSPDPALWGLELHKGEDGRVETVELMGESLQGSAFANALCLPSNAFSVEVKSDVLTFVCKGEGSGCGLSREGAAIYAADGLTCGEILAHYYPDCTVGRMSG